MIVLSLTFLVFCEPLLTTARPYMCDFPCPIKDSYAYYCYSKPYSHPVNVPCPQTPDYSRYAQVIPESGSIHGPMPMPILNHGPVSIPNPEPVPIPNPGPVPIPNPGPLPIPDPGSMPIQDPYSMTIPSPSIETSETRRTFDKSQSASQPKSGLFASLFSIPGVMADSMLNREFTMKI